MNKQKMNKYLEFITTRMKIIYKEKKFNAKNYQLRYMLEKNDSNTLIVVLSGMPREGMKARYNYNRTLRPITANKLFILDDFGYDQRGAYYLGKDKDFEIQNTVIELIDKVKSNLNISKTIYVGSSKGGYAALLFGFQDKNSSIIAGSLQYRLAGYLLSMKTTEEYTLRYIMGKDYTKDDVDFLNGYLKEIINKHANNKPEIYLHYSDMEKNHDLHTKYLLSDLEQLNIEFEEDIEHYKKHADVAYYFPEYLVSTLNKILK